MSKVLVVSGLACLLKAVAGDPAECRREKWCGFLDGGATASLGPSSPCELTCEMITSGEQTTFGGYCQDNIEASFAKSPLSDVDKAKVESVGATGRQLKCEHITALKNSGEPIENIKSICVALGGANPDALMHPFNGCPVTCEADCVGLGPLCNRVDPVSTSDGFASCEQCGTCKPGESLKTCEYTCLLYTSPSPRDRQKSRMPSSA